MVSDSRRTRTPSCHRLERKEGEIIEKNKDYFIIGIDGLIITRAYKERGHATPIDGEIKSVTKNSNTKTQTFSLRGVLGKYTENSKISLLGLVLLKIVTLFISPLNELYALSFYKPLIISRRSTQPSIPC